MIELSKVKLERLKLEELFEVSWFISQQRMHAHIYVLKWIYLPTE